MSTAIANAPAKELRPFLERNMARIEQACVGGMSPARVVTVASLLHYRNPELRKCDPASILASVLRACTLGLDLDQRMCEAYLIPRWNGHTQSMECQFQVGYQGARKLALDSGEISYIQARPVYEKDAFFYAFDPDLKFGHQPHTDGPPGPLVRVYAVAKLKGGDHVIEVMRLDQVEEIHKRSQGYQQAQRKKEAEKGPWVTDYEQMALKTVIFRLSKSLPRCVKLREAIAEEYEEEHGGAEVIEAQPGRSRASQLAETLHRRKAGPALPAPAEAADDDEPAGVPDDAEDAPFDVEARPAPARGAFDFDRSLSAFVDDVNNRAGHFYAMAKTPQAERAKLIGSIHQAINHFASDLIDDGTIKLEDVSKDGAKGKVRDAAKVAAAVRAYAEASPDDFREDLRSYGDAKLKALQEQLDLAYLTDDEPGADG